MMMLGTAGAFAQADMTGRIVNPSFESGADGWANVGMALQTNTSFGLKKGTTYAEKWTAKGNAVGDGSLRQTIVNLPAGTYTLKANAQNIQQDTPTAKQTGVSLIAGRDTTAVGVAGTYSVTATVGSEGTLDIAFVLKGATGNYVCVDDFHLTLDNCTLEELAALLAEAESIAAKKMNSNVAGTLDAAIAAAKAQTSEEGIADVAAALSNSIIAANASVAEYDALLAALEEANAYYATSPENGADELKAVIDSAQAAYDDGTADSTADMVNALAAAVLTCRVANATGKAPTVTSEHFMPVGCAAALGRMTATGSSIIERGYVWATHPNPTVSDNRSTLKYTNNGDIYELSPLEPATEYYVRPYAMTKNYAVGYGEEQRIFTLPQATCRWSYDEAGDAETNDRIRSAVKESCNLYNAWTSIPGFHINAHYVPGAGAGGGTADCSYGGYMRVSQSVSYQRTGTLLHESNHGVGIGTSHRWKNWDGSNLRADGERGQWLGWRATQMVQFFENNNTAILNGDGTHMWPYGINGAHEDNNSMIEYIANVLITHAVHQDGVAAVEGIGASPAYTFEHLDEAKYYITNADAAHGAGTAFLYETSTGLLKWAEAKDTTLRANDSYAWQFEYVPAKAYYRIRNVASGKYFTYNGSSIKTASKATPGNSENFQLMVAFDEVTVGEDKTVTKRPYYIQEGTGIFAPYTLNAGNKGTTNRAALNLNARDEASASQRWLILSEEEAMTVGSARIGEHTGRLQEVIEGAKAMVAVPHADKTEGATEAMETAISQTETAAASLTTISEAKSLAEGLKKSISDFMDAAYPTDITRPYDLTFFIEDRDFTGEDYWEFNNQAVPVVTDGVAAVEGAKFKVTQTLPDIPKGVYTLKVQAYQTVEPTTYIYMNSTAYKAVVNFMDTDEQTAAEWFAEGRYENHVTYKRTSRANMVIGITNTKTLEGDKTVFADFRLYNYGNDVTKDEVEQTLADSVEGIAEALGHQPSAIYDMAGRRVDVPRQGIYICNGRKIVRF